MLAVLEEGDGRILEFEVPCPLVGKTLRDLALPHDSIVGAILRGTHAIVPRGTDALQSGDRLLVFSTLPAADQVRAFFSGGQLAMRLPIVIHLIGTLVRLFGPMLLAPGRRRRVLRRVERRARLRRRQPSARLPLGHAMRRPADKRARGAPNDCGVSKG